MALVGENEGREAGKEGEKRTEIMEGGMKEGSKEGKKEGRKGVYLHAGVCYCKMMHATVGLLDLFDNISVLVGIITF